MLQRCICDAPENGEEGEYLADCNALLLHSALDVTYKQLRDLSLKSNNLKGIVANFVSLKFFYIKSLPTMLGADPKLLCSASFCPWLK